MDSLPMFRAPGFSPRRPHAARSLAVGWLGLVAIASGCADTRAPHAEASSASEAAAHDSAPSVLATIGQEQITLADLRARVGDELDQLDTKYRQVRHKLIETAVRDLVRERVIGGEAKKQGKTVDQLVLAEAGGTLEPTDIETSTWYEANRGRVGGRTLEEVRSQIASHLRMERRSEALTRLEARLNKERSVVVHLEPYRVALHNEGAPSMGPGNAPVTLVEFSDFDCPFCGQFHPTLRQLNQKFGDQLRIVYRQFPIPSLHPNAFKAAEASLCANDQGKFWEMHDLMFREQGRLSVKELKEKAGRIGLDQRRFDQCLDSGRHTERVQGDIKEGTRVGIQGTPALFVNGAMVEGGAVSVETISRVIEQELARAKR